jgi:thiopurine S-methyltransferase
MEAAFWHQRWAAGRIEWHVERVNPRLERHWPAVGALPGAQVLVPLCGKSLDLAWLAAQGHRVLGVEIDRSAVEAVFDEQGLTPRRDEVGAFTRYTAGDIEILCGDIFDLRAAQLAEVVHVFDRASLIALPPAMRVRYAEHLLRVLPRRADWLLITLEYDPQRMQGPPFSVTPDEIEGLFGARMRIRCLEDAEALHEAPGLRSRGLDALRERVSLLRPID